MWTPSSIAAAISATVNNQPPSPTMASTGFVESAMAAPIAIGNAQPSVPKPNGASHERGVLHAMTVCAA